MHEPGVFYHVTRPPWRPGLPLLCWNRLVAAGIRTALDWQHDRVDIGYDGGLIALHMDIGNARVWARRGETILRVRIPPERFHEVRDSCEEYNCFPEEIPADWLEVAEEC